MFRLKSPQPHADDLTAVLPQSKLARLESQWPGIFRREILPMLLDAEADFAELYHGGLGAPNKPIAELVGILILKEFHDYTDAQTLEAVEFNLQWQYALQLGLSQASLCQKTLHNFRDRMVQSQKHQRLFSQLTGRIIDRFGLDTSRQRMDSTHVIGAMKQLTRLGLFVQTIKAFLFKLKRMGPRDETIAAVVAQLPKKFHERYLEREGYFSDTRSSLASRRLEACAQDLWELIDRFRGDPKLGQLKQYRHLQRLFKEQCDLLAPPPPEPTAPVQVPSGAVPAPPPAAAPKPEAPAPSRPADPAPAGPSEFAPLAEPAEAPCVAAAVSPTPSVAPVALKAPPEIASTSLQNPSDPDATFGHKGKGYQFQLAETCVPDNPFQVITTTLLQGAHESDQKATIPLLETLAAQGRKPEVTVADSNYISGENILQAAAMGVALQGPLPGSAPAPDQLTLQDFTFAAMGPQLEACPQGHAPLRQEESHPGGGRRAYFDRTVCEGCPRAAHCPTHLNQTERCLRWTPAQLATARRRHEQETPAFKEAYKIRSGIEATISENKNGHGLGRLRLRGRPAIELVATFKTLALNVKRALKYVQNSLKTPAPAPSLALRKALIGLGRRMGASRRPLLARLNRWHAPWACGV